MCRTCCDDGVTLGGDALERCMGRFDDPGVDAMFTPAFHVARDAAGELAMLVANGDELAMADGQRMGRPECRHVGAG